MILWSLDNFVMRAVADQAKTDCDNLQLCTGLKAGIESATYTLVQRRLERVRRKQNEDEEATAEGEEEIQGVAGL